MEKRQIAVLVLAGLGGVFAALNLDEVDVNWILGTWQTPLIVVIALSMRVGAALGVLVSRRRGGGG
ncbi:MAG: lipopolysaccharide assembly protein LapA domain-containing protein [Solirubrobacterales bacterium]